MPSADQEPRALPIDARFHGLPGLAHGGYVGGLIASALGAESAEVRLRRPIPLPAQATLARLGPDRAELRDGETVLAAGARAELAIDVPPPPSLEQAEAASALYPGPAGHPYPECFACGPARRPGDGLRVFPGPVGGRALVAAAWTPDPGLAGSSDPVSPELVWAAFDCLELWALMLHGPGSPGERAVTASLAAAVERPPRAGEPHVLLAWPLGRDGDRLGAEAALIGPGGELLASGRQTAVIARWGVPLSLETSLDDQPIQPIQPIAR